MNRVVALFLPWIFTLTGNLALAEDGYHGNCGSGWSNPWVRDTWGNADFTDACRNHDECYSTCGVSRLECDIVFKADMKRACKASYANSWHTAHRQGCVNTADTYFHAVREFGSDPYQEAQESAGCE